MKLTVTWNEPVLVCPDEFVAEQFTVVVPTLNLEPEGGEQLTTSVPSFRSVAVAEYVTIAPVGSLVDCEKSAGRFSVGGVSFTVTVNEAVELFPAGSDAEQLTGVVPKPNVEPDAGEHEKVNVDVASSGSDADAEYVTTAPADDVPVMVM